jgi:branched-chain amino acid aminotransferase
LIPGPDWHTRVGDAGRANVELISGTDTNQEESMKAWMNGAFVDWNQTDVPLLSHSFSRGAAVFEVIDIPGTHDGPAFFGMQGHIERFYNSARLIDMDLPIAKTELAAALVAAAKENDVKKGACKFFAHYGDIELKPVPASPRVDVVIFCLDYDIFNVKQADLSAPVTAGIAALRKLHPDTVPVHAKVTGNYVNPFLAKVAVMKRGFEDVIMLDTRGFVAEGATANTFFVTNGRVLTPRLDNALPGITRSAVLEVFADMAVPVEERDILPEEIQDCDEAFFTGSLIRIKPIRSIEGKGMADGCPGPVTARLIDRMAEVYSGRNETFAGLLTPI